MDDFMQALLCDGTNRIPREDDWFAPLLGDWDFDYQDGFDRPLPRHVKGEWLFRRVLDGAGIEDLFICPSRATRLTDPQPDGEYGAALRIYNPRTRAYDMTYACAGKMTRLEFRKEQERLVGTVLDRPEHRWIFSSITPDSFTWQNATLQKDGTLRINALIQARRRIPTL